MRCRATPTVAALLGLSALVATIAIAAGPAVADPAPPATITPAFHDAIPNIPGKTILAVVVTYPPGGKTPSHHHAHSAFVIGYVLTGAIRSQVDGGEIGVFHPGESFREKPGAQHTISENASTTEPATMLAIFVVDSDDKALTTIDPH